MMRVIGLLTVLVGGTLVIAAMGGPAAADSSNSYPPIRLATPAIPTPCFSPSSIPPLPAARESAIEKSVTAFVGAHLNGIGQCGNGLIEITLSPGSEGLAKKVRAKFGPSVQIEIGLTVWDGHPARSPTCGDLVQPSAKSAGYSIALDLHSRRIVSGADLTGHVTLKDMGEGAARPLTSNPVEVVITKPGTRRVVGVFAGAIAGTGYAPLLMPGQTQDVPIVGGTGRCDGGIGSALPPGHYDAVAEVSGIGVDGLGGGVGGQPPPTYFTPFVPIEIIR
jgi:hypothetical protein